MPYVPLDIPPGVAGNGTDLQAAGRWRDVDLVRWVEGVLRPVGGWRTRQSTFITNPPRGALAWRQNDGARWIAAGSYDQLSVMTQAGIVTDITPSDLVDGLEAAARNRGYGGSTYGTGFYGVTRPDNGSYSEATTWSLDTWGEYLVACSTADGRLLEWQLNTSNDAAAITNAPVDNAALLVTEERFLFALGAGGNPRKIQWSDREDNTTWTPAATNEAGDFILQTSGQIMCGVRARGNALILTDTDAHAASYIGPPFVYSIQRVGSSCGAISRRSAVSTPSGVFWMGTKGFHVFDGQSVSDVPCSVFERVFEEMNVSQTSMVWAMSLGQYNEVWWFYPSSTSTEPDRYVTFNYSTGVWAIGAMPRSAGVDQGVFDLPIMMDADGAVYDHEVGLFYGGGAPYAETGPISLGAGDQVMKVTQLVPDEKTRGDVQATFKTRFYPNADETTFGPYDMTAPTDVRFTGRQVRMRVTGVNDRDFRMGIMRINAIPGGRR